VEAERLEADAVALVDRELLGVERVVGHEVGHALERALGGRAREHVLRRALRGGGWDQQHAERDWQELQTTEILHAAEPSAPARGSHRGSP
jgi:hypothetical protein